LQLLGNKKRGRAPRAGGGRPPSSHARKPGAPDARRFMRVHGQSDREIDSRRRLTSAAQAIRSQVLIPTLVRRLQHAQQFSNGPGIRAGADDQGGSQRKRNRSSRVHRETSFKTAASWRQVAKPRLHSCHDESDPSVRSTLTRDHTKLVTRDWTRAVVGGSHVG